MSNINTRVFGSPITPSVQRILTERQLVAKEAEPGEALDDPKISKQINFPGKNKMSSIADLSSRTPFVRMWCAVQLHDFDSEALTSEKVYDEEVVKLYDRWSEDGKETLNAFQKRVGEDKEVLWDPMNQKYYYSRISSKADYEGHILDTKIYTIGNYDKNTLEFGEEKYAGKTVAFQERMAAYSEVFPDEHQVPGDYNKFLKPQAGITSCMVDTQDAYGLTKKTTVNFVVHNFEDFDKIYNTFFLKAGAQLFIDFGWDTADLYPLKNDNLWIDELQKTLFGGAGTKADETIIGNNHGYQDTIMGLVMDYDAKIKENGSVECSVTLISANNALLTYEVHAKLNTKIHFTLDNLIYFDGLLRAREQDDEIAKEIRDALKPNSSTSVDDIEILTSWLKYLSDNSFASKSFVPGQVEGDQSLLSGVFIQKSPGGDTPYICWGKFEDMIINSEFGFGKDKFSINSESTKFETHCDSSQSYTTFSQTAFDYQLAYAGGFVVEGESQPVFLYPKQWYIDEANTDIEAGHNYNMQMYKTPLIVNPDDPATSTEIPAMTVQDWKDDVHLERIPLRDLFINVDTILLALDNNEGKTARVVIEEILKQINDDSMGLFDLTIVQKPGEDFSISVIDRNHVPKENYEKEEQSVGEWWEALFEFDVMSGNSIVKNYSVQQKLPADDLGNIMAINSYSPLSQGNVTDPKTDEILTMIGLTSKLDFNNQDTLRFVRHVPSRADYAQDKEPKENTLEARYGDLYKSAYKSVNNRDPVQKSFTAVDYNESKELSYHHGGSVQYYKKYEYAGKTDDGYNDVTDQEEPETDTGVLTADYEKKLIDEGYRMAGSLKDYYFSSISEDFFARKRPTPVPIYLTMTLYGIASIQPGDTFRVNYLPEIYRDNVYWQTIKVTHNIDSGGWYTTLQTQMRVRPDMKELPNSTRGSSGFFLSNNFLDKLPMPDKNTGLAPRMLIDHNPDAMHTEPETLKRYITKLQPAYKSPNYWDIRNYMMKQIQGQSIMGRINPEPKNVDQGWPAFTFEVTEEGIEKYVTFPAFAITAEGEKIDGMVEPYRYSDEYSQPTNNQPVLQFLPRFPDYAQIPSWLNAPDRYRQKLDICLGEDRIYDKTYLDHFIEFYEGDKCDGQKIICNDEPVDGVVSETANDAIGYPAGIPQQDCQYTSRIKLLKDWKYYLLFHPDYADRFWTIVPMCDASVGSC